MVTGQLTVTAEVLGRVDLRLGIAARSYCPAPYAWFLERLRADCGLQPGDIALAVERAGQDHRGHRNAA